MEEERKNNKKIVSIIILQAIIAIYTMSGVAAKFASRYEFLSFKFILCYAVEIFILGVYAILWQQIIKRFDLSIAYANRSIALLWSMIWAILFFNESVTLKNFVGVIVVIIGTIIVNIDDNKEKVKKEDSEL